MSAWSEGAPHFARTPSPLATAPPPSSSFGAIGYGGRTSGAWGTFYQWDSEAKADSVAKETCAQHGDDCKVIVYFKDGFREASVLGRRHDRLLGAWP